MDARLTLLLVALCSCGGRAPGLFVCAQGAAAIDLRDGESLARRALIAGGAGASPHNITASSAAGLVLATSARSDGAPDELWLIEPGAAALTARIALEPGAGAAHVVASPDGRRAWVTGWASSSVFVIDLAERRLLETVPLGAGRRPHGLRPSPDGERLFTANGAAPGGAGGVIELEAGSGRRVREVPLPGPAVQVAVSGEAVYATIASPASVARIDRSTGDVTAWPLPPPARDPAQLVLSPDGASLFVAEQGTQTDPGTRLLQLSAATGELQRAFEVGRGAHGVELSADGRTAWVTAAFDNTVAAVDLGRGSVVLAGVGRFPNGVAAWAP